MKVFLHKDADKYLSRLNATDRSRIEDAIEKLGKEPPEGDITPITGETGRFRVRVGGFRLLYRIKENTVLVTHIDPRGQAYSKKNKGKKR